ncbi:PilZ domain-containing protein [Methylobacterium sp. J-068]|uniref:PilZ domain-containing protein n=1 Tax=Methylobacterium sp. J-068 TaxID=2836649 RepID=UPI001FBAB6A2|nr:PilZ domain-containing protein [Methylobacterium sp. J-068]MCJ2034011.1 hypothetical protein [Methylobacterium sp. J-068]
MRTGIADRSRPLPSGDWSERCIDAMAARADPGVTFEDRRATRRYAASDPALIRTTFGSPVSCTLVDRSEGGARLKVLSVLGIPDAFVLSVGAEDLRVRVAWRSPSEIGVAFLSE